MVRLILFMKKCALFILAMVFWCLPAPAAVPAADTAAVSLSLSSAVLNKMAVAALRGPGPLKVAEPGLPVLSFSGSAVVLSNLRYDDEACPVLRLAPRLLNSDTAVLKLEKFSLNGEPLSDPGSAPERKREQLARLLDAFANGIAAQLGSEGPVALSFDTATLVMQVRLGQSPLWSGGSKAELRRFGVSGGTLRVAADNGAPLGPVAGDTYFSVGERLLTRALKAARINELSFEENSAGLTVSRGEVSLSGRAKAGMRLPRWMGSGDLAVRFTATAAVWSAGRNTLKLRVKNLVVHQVYHAGAPLSSVPKTLQDYARGTLIDLGLQALVNNKNIARYARVTQNDENTVTLVLRPDAFLPGAAVNLEEVYLSAGVFSAVLAVK